MKNDIRRSWWLPTVAVLVIAVFPALQQRSANAAESIEGKVTASKDKYLKNAIVYIDRVDGSPSASSAVQMDQVNQTFVPFVLPVVEGTTVTFLNNDNTGHNIFTPDGEEYDLGTFDKGETAAYTFAKQGVYTQLCKLHPSMIAYIVVLQNQFFAVTSDDGSFSISGVPPGTYDIKVWHERLSAEPLSVTVGAAEPLVIPLQR